MEDSFVLFTKISETVSELTNEEKGMLFQAILDYQSTGEVPEMDKLIRLVFLPIKHDMDYCAEKRAEAQEQKSIAGKKSAEARAAKKAEKEHESTPLNTVEQRSTPLNTGQHNGNVNVNVTNKDNNPPYPPLPGGDTPKAPRTPKTKKEKEQHNLRLLAEYASPYTMSMPLYETLTKWAVYKGQHNFAYEPLGMQSLLTTVNKSVKQYGEAAVIERISASMGDGYAGMLLDKLDKDKAERTRYQKPNRFHNLEERPADNIDQESVEQMRARILGR